MSELNYSKKQLTPVINKFKINVNENHIFQNLIRLFANQPNYQLWAVKTVFSSACSYEIMVRIHNWITNYASEIKNLKKQNVTSYSSKSDIQVLLTEMDALARISKVRNSINVFNTRQKHMMKEHIFPSSLTDAIMIVGSKNYMKWEKVLNGLEKMVGHKKAKLISTASAIENLDTLFTHIKSALEASYKWTKDDMISFMSFNTPDSSIVYDNGDIVIVNVNSFEDSRKLCGNGRTGWCLTREERYFNSYVKEKRGANQFFLFDFSRREDDELAHVGFTVCGKDGITNAHSTRNYSLTGGGITLNGKSVTIYDVLKNCNIPRNIYMCSNKNKHYDWDLHSFVETLNTKYNSSDYEIRYCANNIAIVLIKNTRLLEMLLEHSYVNYDRSLTHYLIFNFNNPYNGDNAIVDITYKKDQYGIETLVQAKNIFNEVINVIDYLSQFNCTQKDFIASTSIDPKILIHKYVTENDENSALQLLEENGEELDVNYSHNNIPLIFRVIDMNMPNLFNKIVNSNTFDSNVSDSFGESLLQSLLFSYLAKPNEKRTVDMINHILNSDSFNFNCQDINYDTALMIACDYNELHWVAEALLSKPQVDVNAINDLNRTALGVAIENKDIALINLISRREDVIVREADIKLANECGIDLSSYFSSESLENPSTATNQSNNESEDLDLAELFATVLRYK